MLQKFPTAFEKTGWFSRPSNLFYFSLPLPPFIQAGLAPNGINVVRTCLCFSVCVSIFVSFCQQHAFLTFSVLPSHLSWSFLRFPDLEMLSFFQHKYIYPCLKKECLSLPNLYCYFNMIFINLISFCILHCARVVHCPSICWINKWMNAFWIKPSDSLASSVCPSHYLVVYLRPSISFPSCFFFFFLLYLWISSCIAMWPITLCLCSFSFPELV